MSENKGTQAFKAAGEKLKAAVAQDKALAVSQQAIANAQLSEAAMAYLSKHAKTGADDLNTGVAVPQLRIHSVGASTKNQLVNGEDPTDGQLFHTGLQEAWNEVPVIILAIKKCRLEQRDDNGELVVDEQTGEAQLKATYLVAGLLDESLQPFVLYVKGLSYNKMWDLEDQLKPYVTKRAGGIPLSMVKIMVSSEKEVVEMGRYKGQKKNVLKFTLIKAGEFPVLENDGERLEIIERGTQQAEEMLEDIVANKGISEKEWNVRKKESQEAAQMLNTVVNAGEEPVQEAEVAGPPDDYDPSTAEDVSEDIPF